MKNLLDTAILSTANRYHKINGHIYEERVFVVRNLCSAKRQQFIYTGNAASFTNMKL